MKSLFLTFAVVFLAADASGASCSRLFASVGDYCLRFFPDAALKWSEAQSRCDVIGGHLAQVDDCGLLGQIATFIVANEIAPVTGAYWIGASDVINEGNFVWVSDLTKEVPMGVPFWGVSSSGFREPDGGYPENCVAITTADGYHFHDEECDNLYGVLCEEDRDTAVQSTLTSTSTTTTRAPFSNGTNFTNIVNEEWKEGVCPVGYTHVANGCYLALTNAVETWDAARLTCNLNGGRLARLGDCNVLGSLSSYLQGLIPRFSNYWIGISDQDNEGIYQYADGTIAFLTSVFWGQTNGVKEPNGGTLENCVALIADDDYYFHDELCTSLHGVLCEAEFVEYLF